MHPVISFGAVRIPAYALFTWLGALTACAIAWPALRRAGLSAPRRLTMLAAAAVSFLVCARLWNVVVNPGNFLSMPWYAPKLAGLSLYGGLAGAAAAMLLCARAAGVSPLRVLDAMTVPGGVAFCLARIGCFLNGCCGGIATNGPFGVAFPKEDLTGSLPGILSFVGNRPVHPTQLYELVGAAAALAVIAALDRTGGRIPGTRFLCYAALFSLVRLAVLPLRVLPYPAAVKNVLYPGLYLGVIAVSAAGICLLRRNCRANTERPRRQS